MLVRVLETPASFVSLAARETQLNVASQGQPWLRAYRKHSRCPLSAAQVHVSACAYWRHSRCPCAAASTHVIIPGAVAVLVRVPETLRRPRGSRVARARIVCPRSADTPGARRSQQTLQLPLPCSTANDPLLAHVRRHSRCPPLAAKQQTTPFSNRHDSPESFIARQHAPDASAKSPRSRRSSSGSMTCFRTSGGRDPKSGPSPSSPIVGFPFSISRGVDRVLVDGVRHFRAAREGVRWGVLLSRGAPFLGPAVFGKIDTNPFSHTNRATAAPRRSPPTPVSSGHNTPHARCRRHPSPRVSRGAARVSAECARPRAFPARPRAPSVRRLRVVAASSAADRPPRDDAAPSPSASTTAPKPKGGKRDLADAYREVGEILTDPTRLVRAVASGKARGADPQWRRLEMRPVALKKGIKLQVVKYDERQAFTSNHPYPTASNSDASRGRSRGRRGGASSASSSPSSVPARVLRPSTARSPRDRQLARRDPRRNPPAQSHQIRRGARQPHPPTHLQRQGRRIPKRFRIPRRSRVARPRQIPTLGPVRSVPGARRRERRGRLRHQGVPAG